MSKPADPANTRPPKAAVDPTVGETALHQIQDSIKPPPPASGIQSRFNSAGNTAFKAGETLLSTKEMIDQGMNGYSAVTKTFGDPRNEILNNMIQLTDKLVDIGKVVPFIAPAFVVLKFIIDIEKKAREADEKCQDLMERINFMISHILVLERIEIMDTLRTVLQRVQDVLKEAAALIEAYRKQGKIARRLKMSNTQNFESMAGKISSCSSDLMMSLQIQQTGDLSVLKRSVPRDLVAEDFIKEHGGQDVINSNPELVKLFADKVHLVMSDKVMEQMQSNMHELMAENQHQIEELIRQSSATGVADMIKAIASQQREWEAELKLTCVQCEKEYVVSANGPSACGYHPGVGNANRYNCCHNTTPCKTGYHQSEHHSKYPYSTFFIWAYGLLGYHDMVDYWANIRDFDLDVRDSTQIARVGQLLRWKTCLSPVTTPLMLVSVGDVRDNRSCYLQVFDVTSLERARIEAINTGNTVIFKNAPEEEETAFSMAEWIMDQETQQITGIKLTVKVTSTKTATICVVPIDPKSLKMPSGKSIEYLSRATTEIFKPDKPYEFPETILRGPHLSETRLREPREFKTKASPKVPLVLMTPYEMVANNSVMTSVPEIDRFLGFWRGLNKAPLSSQNQIVLMSAKAEYRLVGEEEYRPVKWFGLRSGTKFPISIAPMESVDIPFEFVVDKPQAVIERRSVAINFAHLTIHNPLRVRVTFTDVEGETVSLVQEYVHKVNGVTTRQEEDIGFFYLDDVDLSQRTLITIKEPKDPKKHVVDICAGYALTNKISELDLRRIVHNAEHTGVTQVDMKIGFSDLGLNWNCWALVDLSCKRVYGFKVMAIHGSMTPVKYSGCLGYAPCPLYGGDGLETRPIQYADEENNELITEHRDEIVVVEDDTYDDDVDPDPTPAPAPAIAREAGSAAPAPSPVATPTPTTVVSTTSASEKEVAVVPIKATEVADNGSVVAAVASSTPVSPSNATIDMLQTKIAALEARIEVSERHEALMAKILALEKKLEAKEVVPASAVASQGVDRVSVLENRLASMDQKMDTMNINLRLLDGNVSRLANSLEKIASILSV
ncbi:hypothetical protein BGX21_006616 [Mortierella sp. AD011]|nr:hypothetical protein BGX21_006616 [Mortierella sp. AD011]